MPGLFRGKFFTDMKIVKAVSMGILRHSIIKIIRPKPKEFPEEDII